MPIRHRIDHERRVVLALAHGTITEQDVFGYQREVWSRDDVAGYDELIDMLHVREVVLPDPDRVKDLAQLAAKMDRPQGRRSKFAIVAPTDLSFGLGRMFQAWRARDERSGKDVEVFRTLDEALAWLDLQHPIELPRPGDEATGRA